MNIPKPSPIRKLSTPPVEKPEPPKPVKKDFRKPKRNVPKPTSTNPEQINMKLFVWMHPDALFDNEPQYIDATDTDDATNKIVAQFRVTPIDLREVKSHIWVCIGNDKRREVKARTKLEAGPLCQEKYGFWPESIEKKEFDRPEHLTHRPFADHPVLQMMRNTDSKNKKNAGKGAN